MSTNKQGKAKQNLLKQIEQLPKADPKQQIQWLLRSLLVSSKKNLQAGFVLPTVVLVLLVMGLTVAALLFRSFSRTTQVIGQREQQQIYNAATPAIDRAKSKLEYLFKKDNRLPSGVPSSLVMLSMMLNDGKNSVPKEVGDDGKPKDTYTFPNETRLDINNDGNLDNAWVFEVKDNKTKDNKTQKVAYSILLETESGTIDIKKSLDADKAKKLIVRNGPITNSEGISNNCPENRTPEKGWFPLGNASLSKSFQVNAFAINDNPANRTVTTLELQQDRQINRGNKWGVWFRNDLEIFPGPTFNMNGSMHTEGNLIIAGDKTVNSYMVSSHNSCIYSQDASEITVAQNDETEAGKEDAFEGQIVSGTVKNNKFESESYFHLFNGLGVAPVTSGDNTKLNPGTDSVKADKDNLVEAISLDPISLFTQNKSKHRSLTGWSRDSAWKDSEFVKQKRIYNSTSPQPYVDDTYRADDRYGPKPTYSNSQKIPPGKKVGDQITANLLLTSNSPPENPPESFGLDGYWERRARANGLRLIVGQRLELGNAFGWDGANDPLNPPDVTLSSEGRQRRTLRDNLAAVQATAIYHHEKSDGNFPVAFLATTVHPGTDQTLQQSKTFKLNTNTNTLNIDFLGVTPVDTNSDGVPDTTVSQGTNGWEFEVVPGAGETEDTFKKLIDDKSSQLRKALTNLARFAGDPDGAFPPLQEAAGSKIVHPLPELSMWGDFSNLRRVISKLDAKTEYNALSIADKSTLHTAAGTLGMLAYNIQNYQDTYNAIASDKDSSKNMQSLGINFLQLMDGTVSKGNPEISRPKNGTNLCIEAKDCPDIPDSKDYNPDYYKQFTAKEWINALVNDSSGTTAEKADLLVKAQLLKNRQQILRDRTFGFAKDRALPGSGKGYSVSSSGKGTFKTQNSMSSGIKKGTDFSISCDPDSFSEANSDKAQLGLAMVFCSSSEQNPKYPSLFYIFPVSNHSHAGDSSATPPNDQPTTEPYIADSQDLDADSNKTELHPYITKTTVNGTDINTYQALNSADPNDFSGILLNPKNKELTAGCTDINWCLPTATNGANLITIPKATQRAIPFLDTALSNGREMMSVRVLNVDLDILRKNKVTKDTWLPVVKEGIVFAFREDAAREDSIARPASTTWANYLADPTKASYVMNANTPQDPPINADNGISPKPVDYYADPERRPYGFRLRNGQNLKRDASISDADNIDGLSFISDNPVYIQGDFNLHSTDGTVSELIEEFKEKLDADWTKDPKFYDGRKDINESFADPTKDTWRPSEILSDAITIVSSNFIDGDIEDTFTNPREPGANTTNTSYQNYNRPNNSSIIGYWLREDPSKLANGESPIKVNKNGYPLYCATAIPIIIPCPLPLPYGGVPLTETYRDFSKITERRKDLITPPNNTRVNAIFISGLVPSRANQPYGGLHNFPRFLEFWKDKNLFISGAFLQLNFSTSATAPFDQDSWEPGNSAKDGGEYIGYYDAPNRRWGYDVGLLYAPAGPAARRFITAGNTRSEFYRELPVEDPYIKNLRCANFESKPIDPSATTCPTKP